MRPLRHFRALFALLIPAQVAAATCSDLNFEGTPYTICEVAASDEARLFLNDPAGRLYGSFGAIEADLGPLVFAMNAGMYHEDRAPVGHYVEDRIEAMRLITSAGPGNFGMLPNGVLCIEDQAIRVIETLAFADERPDCVHASQSGPMLVIDGALHPRFIPDGTSRNIRNGVGTTADGSRAVFAISNAPVNFHEFARLFRDALGLPQALYFDGRVSRLHLPAAGRSDPGPLMGPIVGVLADSAGG
jgi:uncharacterized protein YigE (DUF2233 family)